MLNHELLAERSGLRPVDTVLEDRQRPAFAGFTQRIWSLLRDQGPFLAITAQFYLIVKLVAHFQIESITFARVMDLTFWAFIVHHFLPMRWRRPFFALLSVAATIRVLRLGPGGVLVAIGLTLIGICHLPLSFRVRAALLAAVAMALAFLRAYAEPLSGFDGMWVILGSMFIFRIMNYLYDLKHRTAPFTPTLAVSYFFMLPNVCFPLFPVVDYKTFCTQYFNGDALRIYQTGIVWMFRGLVQLLLYRLVYHYGMLNIADVTNAKDVAEFAVATYLLYLHVSGQFHLIVGLLHLFGLNLPETHHRYLLASSFTDFWRRINIYWKDFIMKLFFYPAFFALRRIGTLPALALATLCAFFATWALHSWQWFWIRGHFLVTWQDVSFWCILAMLVMVNAIYEAVVPRRRALSKSRFDLRTNLVVAGKTVGTFVVICSLWTMWSCQSWDELRVLAECATRVSWADAGWIAAGLAALGIAGALWGGSTREIAPGASAPAVAREPRAFWRSAAAIGAAATCLLVLSFFALDGPSVGVRLFVALSQDQLNARDMDTQRRGYYEELDMARANYRVWRQVHVKPASWESDGIRRDRHDFLGMEFSASFAGVLYGADTTTNRWGMRDREYEKAKPSHACRMVLLGSSHDAGAGVRDDETFENVVEARLNHPSRGSNNTQYEILNLSNLGRGVIRNIVCLEWNGFDFEPDGVLFSVNANDQGMDLLELSDALRKGAQMPHTYLDDLFRRAQVDNQLDDLLIQHRLRPHLTELYEWAFRRLADECSRRGIWVAMIFRPRAIDLDRVDSTSRDEMAQLAAKAGIEFLDLSSAFDQVEDRDSLTLAAWDDHTNALGHRLLGDKLYEQLVPILARHTKDGFRETSDSADAVAEQPTNTPPAAEPNK